MTTRICFHEIVFIDHQGKTCGLCGLSLEGYGVASPFPGKQTGNEGCLHGETAWITINKSEEQCKYCRTIRKLGTKSQVRASSEFTAAVLKLLKS